MRRDDYEQERQVARYLDWRDRIAQERDDEQDRMVRAYERRGICPFCETGEPHVHEREAA